MAMVLLKGTKAKKLKRNLKRAATWFQESQAAKAVLAKRQTCEIAIHLADGAEERARPKVEELVRNENTAEAYEILQLYCELLSEGIHLMSECPPDLIMYGVTLVWAATIVDLPELRELRKHFQDIYGGDFDADAATNSGGLVNDRVVNKLLAPRPTAPAARERLGRIAREHGVNWRPRGDGRPRPGGDDRPRQSSARRPARPRSNSFRRKGTGGSSTTSSTSATSGSTKLSGGYHPPTDAPSLPRESGIYQCDF